MGMPKTPPTKKTVPPTRRTPPESLEQRARWDAPLGRIFAKGYPLTKGVYLWEANEGEPPEFPVHPELQARIPRELSGPVPQTIDEYYKELEPLLRLHKPVTAARPRRRRSKTARPPG
jgi:hypothetical protein